MARQKKRITEKTLKAAIYGSEPNWSEYSQPSDESRKISLIVALQYFNSEYDKKKSWSFVKTWLKQNISLFPFLEEKKDIDSIESVFSAHFVSSIYSLMRCQKNGLILNTTEINHIREHLKLLLKLAKKISSVPNNQQTVVSQEKKLSPIDRVRMKVDERIIPELEGFLDDIIRNRRSAFSAFSLPELIEKDESLSGSVSNVAMLQPIIDWSEQIKTLLDELDANPDDTELQEAYPSFDKRTRNRLRKYIVNGLPEGVNEYNESLKQKRKDKKKTTDTVTRTPRKTKPVDPTKLVARFRIQQEDQEHTLTSHDPKKIIGASCVILYNTKYKMIHLIQAPEGGALSVKGMAITGFDEAGSFAIRLRKPADVLPLIKTKTKLQIIKQLQSLTTKATNTKGRTTDTTMILRIFN